MLKYKFLKLLIFSFFISFINYVPITNAANDIDLSCEGCNVLFLNIGILRADHVGLINPEKELTPNTNKFFDKSIIFEQAITPSGASYYSATSIVTSTETMLNKHKPYTKPYTKGASGGGRWSVLTTLKQDGKFLVDYFPTIAEVLLDNEYYTVSINDWIHTGKEVFLDRGFKEYRDFTAEEKSSSRLASTVPFDKQVEAVYNKLSSVNDKQFFLYFHPNSLHFPYLYPSNSSSSNYILRDTRRQNLSRQSYAEQVSYIDRELSKIFNFLTEEDLLSNTLVVLYSNHGIGLGDNGIYTMGVPYQSNVHVPLLIKHPRVKKQIRIKDPVSLTDLAPTLYDILGIKVKHNISGYSLIPLIIDGQYEREFIFGKDLYQEFVRKENWKIIITGNGNIELYNISEDPHELNNIYQSNQEIARDLETALINKKIEQLQFGERMNRYFNITEKNTVSVGDFHGGRIIALINKKIEQLQFWERMNRYFSFTEKNTVSVGYFHGGKTHALYRSYVKEGYPNKENKSTYIDAEGVDVRLMTQYSLQDDWYKLPKSHKGFYKLRQKQKGFGVVTGLRIIEEIDKNNLDGGTAGESSFIEMISKGSSIVAVAKLGYESQEKPAKILLVHKDVIINNSEDFKGMTFGVRIAGAGDRIIMYEFLESIGLDYRNDVKIIYDLPGILLTKYLNNKTTQASLYHFQTGVSTMEKYGHYSYPMNRTNSTLSQALLVFDKDFIKQHPGETMKIVKAYMKRLKYEKSLTREERINPPGCERLPCKGLEMERVYEKTNSSIAIFDYPPTISIESLEQQQELLYKYGIIDKKVNIENFVDNSFVNRVFNEMNNP